MYRHFLVGADIAQEHIDEQFQGAAVTGGVLGVGHIAPGETLAHADQGIGDGVVIQLRIYVRPDGTVGGAFFDGAGQDGQNVQRAAFVFCQMLQNYLKVNKNRSIWRKLVRVMACIVVFCTTYALILPVITLDDYSNVGVTYVEPVITVSGCELVSVSCPCDQGHTSHDNAWYNCGMCHTIVLRITDTNASIDCNIQGYDWPKDGNAVTITNPGGDLGMTISGTLGNYIGADSNKTFQVYTAVNQYNRLHYLEESISRAIYQLSDANVENTATLIRFTKLVDETQCMGPMELTPDNAEELVNAVNAINTAGGTRQDLALQHAHDHLTGNVTYADGSNQDKYTKDPDYTFTILITDGAPVRSDNSAPELSTIYSQIRSNGAKVRQESILVTPGAVRPAANVHNGPGSPGTEVSDEVASKKLEEGYGIVDKDNVHIVNVICGSIRVTKEITPELVSDQDQVFLFTLHREEDGDDRSADMILEVTVPAGQTTGSVQVDNLKRGTYTLTEQPSEVYAIRDITIETDTNCWASAQTPTAIFHMGNDPSDNNVIGKVKNARYTSYVAPPYGVFGAAKVTNEKTVYYGEIPVTKLWGGTNAEGREKTVHVVLYRQTEAGEQLVLDTAGNARLLRLDKDNNWQGSFRVALPEKDAAVETLGYFVREVSGIGSTAEGRQRAILENDGTTALYYQSAVDPNTLLELNGSRYMVTYAIDEATGANTVTNHLALTLPATGGIGTTMFYLFGSIMFIGAAVLLITKKRMAAAE